ncbi:MAG: FG-GAP-like repeat-containing protein [Acidobacteriia bacterium]|nr:FG-GAP-like repeat-containing protein [Terriglobia bacterium]
MKKTIHAESSSLGTRRILLAFVARLFLTAALVVVPLTAYGQNPAPVDFVSGQLFSGVGHGDRIPGAANVYTMAVGDFNKDGNLDLVTTNNSNVWGLGLVLGNGDGTFQSPAEVVGNDFGGVFGGIVAGDFNKEGNLDFAVLWVSGGPVYVGVYLNNGHGNFTLTSYYSIGSAGYNVPRSLATADVNGDGNLDLIAPDRSNWAVAVLYGKGDGTFPSSAEFLAAVPNQTAPTGVAAGDLNKDGKPDIVVASATGCCPWGGGINVLLNNGNGTFQSPVLYSDPSGVDNGLVAVADLNADGKLDVVESSEGGFNVAVFLGNGTGTFQTAKTYVVPCASAVAVGELTGDKKPELVVSSYYDGTVWVLLNKGSGNFQLSSVYAADSSAMAIMTGMAIALADFNGDKKLDFVAGNPAGQFVTIGLGNGDGTFRDSTLYNESVQMWTNGIAVADFNLDGSLDIVQAGGGTGVGLNVMLGTSHGVLGAPASINLGASQWGPITFVRAADLDGDGKPDIVSSTPYSVGTPGVEVLLGLGTGKFKTPVIYPVSTSSYAAAGALADVNGDGKLDIVTSNYDGSVSVLFNKGNGKYGTSIVSLGVTADPSYIAAGDFNKDGKLDLVLSDWGAIKTVLLPGKGDGTFQSPLAVSSSLRPTGPAMVGDFNKDGKLDLAILAYDFGGSMTIFLGNGNGTFATGATYDLFPQDLSHQGQFAPSGTVVDLNADGNLDLAIAPRHPWYSTCGNYRCAEEYLGAAVYLGKGDGTFVAQSGWLAGVSPTWVAAGDFNRDGMTDLAFLNTDTNWALTSVTILQNATHPLSISPLNVTFAGTRNVGTSVSQTVILTNNQSTKLTISSSTALTGPNAADYVAKSTCGTSLVARLHCTITVTFKPLAPLTRTASLVITDSLGTQSVPLTGVATEVKLSNTSRAFGSVLVGQTKAMSLTLTNIGSTAMSILSPGIVITGTAVADYSQTNTCGASVAGGSYCTISVTFKPTKKGSRSAVLNINDDGGPSPQKVTLSGTGI